MAPTMASTGKTSRFINCRFIAFTILSSIIRLICFAFISKDDRVLLNAADSRSAAIEK
jgi:hypothetical protein